MSPIRTLNIIAITACLALVASPAAVAKNKNACLASMKAMDKSCRAELREEYNATLARCESIEDEGERAGCRDAARHGRKDAGNSCGEQKKARRDVCDLLGENRYLDPLTDASITFIDPDDIGEVGGIDDNPFVILKAGHTHLLRAEEYDEEEDEVAVELIIVHATDETREIEGVVCRVVIDIVVEPEWDEEEGKWEFEAIEVTDDWFAQDIDENVYYCGEVARNFEDGVLRDLDGSFEAGLDLAEGGFLTKAAPQPGDVHRQEYAIGEAEDIVEYVSLFASPLDEGIDDSPAFPCGPAGSGDCLLTHDSTPLEPGGSEYKYYLPGIGFVLAVPLEDGEIIDTASEWLVCSGEELAVLESSECGFDSFGDEGDDVRESVLETICELSNELCDDGEE